MGAFSKRIDDGNDDGYGGGASWFPSFNIIQTGEGGLGDSNVGLRFTGVTLLPGVVVTDARITLYFSGGSNNNQNLKVYGIDEDNTASLSSDPRARAHTSAAVDWDFTGASLGTTKTTPDLSAIVQEIIDRGGWSSGNAMGFLIEDDGSTFAHSWDSYEGSTIHAALLEITYSGSSPSASQSPSSSPSPSPSASLPPGETRLLVAKPGKNALTSLNPTDFIFHSGFGTLKYFAKVSKTLTIDGAAGDFAARDTYDHNLGYYPYAEVYVRVYIGSPSGNYEYVPFAGAGATVLYSANYRITESQIILYGEFNGVSSSTWTFDFLIFLYKNNLNF